MRWREREREVRKSLELYSHRLLSSVCFFCFLCGAAAAAAAADNLDTQMRRRRDAERGREVKHNTGTRSQGTNRSHSLLRLQSAKELRNRDREREERH
jgi:hypothetical protein